MTQLISLAFLVLVMMTRIHAEDVSGQSLRVVPSVDLSRYCGTWYEIARLQNRFQEGCVGDVTATYTLLDDGEMKVINRCREENGEFVEAEGRARRSGDNDSDAKLQVRFAPAFLSFLPFVWGDYWIIDLAPDYSYAAVGAPSRKYLWILARSANLTEETYREIVGRLKGQGYDTSQIVRTKHGM